MDCHSDMDKPRRTLNLNYLVKLYLKYSLRKSQDKYKSRHYNHRLDRVWKNKGTVPLNVGKLKVKFCKPKVFKWGRVIECSKFSQK